MSRAYDSTLASDIRHLIDNLDEKIYNIIRDYQEEFGCEVILIDDNQNHCQIEIHNTGKVEVLRQRLVIVIINLPRPREVKKWP